MAHDGMVQAALDELGQSNSGALARLLRLINPTYSTVTVGAGNYNAPAVAEPHLVVMVDSTGGTTTTVFLPPNPAVGSVITVTDLSGLLQTGGDISVDGNGQDIEGSPTLSLDPSGPPLSQTEYKSYTLMFQAQTTPGLPSHNGWRIIWTYPGTRPGFPP